METGQTNRSNHIEYMLMHMLPDLSYHNSACAMHACQCLINAFKSIQNYSDIEAEEGVH